jgi:hypothetical protein
MRAPHESLEVCPSIRTRKEGSRRTNRLRTCTAHRQPWALFEPIQTRQRDYQLFADPLFGAAKPFGYLRSDGEIGDARSHGRALSPGRAVLLEPRDKGMVLWTLRYGDEVRNEAKYFV